MLKQDAPDTAQETAYAWRILPHVSRTFALTIPVLEEPLRTQVGISYLLCRIVDTVEDHGDLDAGQRASLFSHFAQLAHEPRDPRVRDAFQSEWRPYDDPHYEDLVQHAGLVLDSYAALEDPVRAPIAACLDEMIEGMSAFPAPGDPGTTVFACGDLTDLERYCHAVAGTVGILLSRLFALSFADDDWLTPQHVEQGRLFGLGLQLTNILKDYRRDAERGISYIPSPWLTQGDGAPVLSREGTRVLVTRALEFLDASQDYVVSLPRSRPDMRLFCLWAQHLALATLYLVATHGPTGEPVKVSREDVPSILDRAQRYVDDDRALGNLYRGYRHAVRLALDKL